MKKLLLTLTVAISSYYSYAQNQIGTTGYVGIGTTNPLTYLHVVGQGTSLDNGDQNISGGGIIIQSNNGSRSTTTGAQIEFVIPVLTDGTGAWGRQEL